jgi:hypothetical protein
MNILESILKNKNLKILFGLVLTIAGFAGFLLLNMLTINTGDIVIGVVLLPVSASIVTAIHQYRFYLKEKIFDNSWYFWSSYALILVILVLTISWIRYSEYILWYIDMNIVSLLPSNGSGQFTKYVGLIASAVVYLLSVLPIIKKGYRKVFIVFIVALIIIGTILNYRNNGAFYNRGFNDSPSYELVPKVDIPDSLPSSQ